MIKILSVRPKKNCDHSSSQLLERFYQTQIDDMSSSGTARTALDKHQSKRHIQQSQITNYFSTNRESNENDYGIQASLLNVGMRIRKAVPEGYKTHKTALLNTSSNNNLNSNSQKYPVFTDSILQQPRYLVPFCGIHKVGGLGVQETMQDELYYGNYTPGGPVNSHPQSHINVFDDFQSSQESTLSVMEPDQPINILEQSFTGSKRSRDEDEHDFDSNEISMTLDSGLEGRCFAKPHSRRRPFQSVGQSTGQQAVLGSLSHEMNFDFGEASFLVPYDDEIGL